MFRGGSLYSEVSCLEGRPGLGLVSCTHGPSWTDMIENITNSKKIGTHKTRQCMFGNQRKHWSFRRAVSPEGWYRAPLPSPGCTTLWSSGYCPPHRKQSQCPLSLQRSGTAHLKVMPCSASGQSISLK